MTYEQEAKAVIARGLVQPAYDYMLKCSHAFNLLEAREPSRSPSAPAYITRVRNIARQIAQTYIEQRRNLGFPRKDAALRQKLV